ncbi:MAG TPA: hypothetical protein VG737_16330, partial [Cyclobacteriaceae bacterium]|nr:hypothetical protein [Cyclobacteriaceae bacterium]
MIVIILGIVAANVAGTSAMTLFSAVAARAAHADYIEPHLLNRFISTHFHQSARNSPAAGWFTHFFVGLLFVIVYHILWTKQLVTGSAWDATILGFFSGMLGAT